jgi:hypothetical protein
MLSEGAITYEEMKTMPVSEILMIWDRLEYVVRERKNAIRRITGGR